jgi:glutamyl-tRNA synthetase
MDKKLILKYALNNALMFNGKANIGSVIGKVLQEKPELKSKIKELQPLVKETVDEVNALPLEDQKVKLDKLDVKPIPKKKQEKKGELPDLKNAIKGKFITRIPPEPSKYLHIGHALSFLINYLYSKKYEGKCVLRFEDTNPEKSSKEYLDSIKEDLEWLDIKSSKEVIVSNDMEKIYNYAETLIKKGNAYVCGCPREQMSTLRNKGQECGCRSFPLDRNIKEWQKMKDGTYKDGEVILRLKADMESNNYAMRDPVLFRICNTKHYLHGKKYSAWPMYDLAGTIEDELCNITHILRSGEFGEMRVELQNYLKQLLGFKIQTIIQYGRFNVIGATTQGREIRELIEQKKVIGWDDPSLVTLKALRRRGIVKESFYQLAKEIGLSKTQTNIDFQLIASINRKILDSKCNRYFFINQPIKIKVEKAPAQKLELKLHPDFPEKGKRTFETKDEFYITKEDHKALTNNKLYRLMDSLNFIKKTNKLIFDSLEHEKYKEKGEKIIHWLPVHKDLVDVEVLMPDKKVIKGKGEQSLTKLKEGDIIQFTRFGFCRLDKKEKDKFVFWYTHD